MNMLSRGVKNVWSSYILPAGWAAMMAVTEVRGDENFKN
jgi:hypothetical protein